MMRVYNLLVVGFSLAPFTSAQPSGLNDDGVNFIFYGASIPLSPSVPSPPPSPVPPSMPGVVSPNPPPVPPGQPPSPPPNPYPNPPPSPPFSPLPPGYVLPFSEIDALETYSIDWEQVSTSFLPYTGATETPIPDCPCDLDKLGMNGCEPSDPPCYCTCPDSSDDPLASSPGFHHYCFPKSQLSKTNLPSSEFVTYTVNREQSQRSVAEFCVAPAEGAVRLKSYEDPGVLEAGDWADVVSSGNESGAERFFFQQDTFLHQPERQEENQDSAAGLRVGHPLTAYLDSGEPENPLEEPLSVPAAALSEACLDGAAVVRFGVNLPASPDANSYASCRRTSTDLAVECESALSAARFLNLTIGTNREPVAVVEPVLLADAFGRLAPAPDGVSATARFDSATGTCMSALHSLHYVLTHNGQGSVSLAQAHLVVTNLPMHAFGGASLKQRYKVTFYKSGEEGSSRPRSGNPGYLVGAPLLAGVRVHSGEEHAVARLVNGLPLVGPVPDALGACGARSHAPVRFHVNQLSTCSVHLTASELEDFCLGRGTASLQAFLRENNSSLRSSPVHHPPLPLQLIDGLAYGGIVNPRVSMEFANQALLIGSWGNAEAEHAEDWQDSEMALLPTPPDMAWNADTQTCEGVVVGVGFEFLSASAGQLMDLQQKVEQARASYIKEDWQVRPELVGQIQRFHLKFTTRFVPMAQPTIETIPLDRRTEKLSYTLFPRFPEDVLYVFHIHNTPRRAYWQHFVFLAPTTALLFLIWAWYVGFRLW